MTPVSLAQDSSTCGSPRALCGWSPPPSPADTPLKRAVDRYMPRTGVPVILFFAAVVGLLLLAPHLPRAAELAGDALAAGAGGAWCGLNFWRCRHAHCLITAGGWLAVSGFALAESVLGPVAEASQNRSDDRTWFLPASGASYVWRPKSRTDGRSGRRASPAER